MFPPQIGGNGHWMWELYSRLPRDRFVIAADRSVGAEAFDRTHDVPVVRMPLQLGSWGVFGWQRGTDYLRLYSRLCRLVRELGIDVVHASNSLPEGFLAWMLYRRLRLPYLVYAHGEELNVASTSRELSWMARRIYRDANLIVANSRNTARLLQNSWPVSAERIQVMHPGVDTTCYRPAPRDHQVRARLVWGDRPVVLIVGRLTKRKGHEELIRSLPAIRRQIPNVLLAIVGEGQLRGQLEQVVAELSLGEHVKFHGEIKQDELVAAFQQCDVFAMPNLEVAGEAEGFGIVFLEAQACGKPVIAGDSGGTAEAINAPESGYTVNPKSPDELARALITLFQDDARRAEMGQAGRRWVVEKFDWEILALQAKRLFGTHFTNDISCGLASHPPTEPSLSSHETN